MKKVSLFLFVTFISVLQLYAASHGKCGSNLTWALSDSGDLVISGEGAMNDFRSGSIPWNPYLVKTVKLEEGITHIGSNSFADTRLYYVIIPVSVKSIGNKAFASCGKLTSVQLPYGLVSIGDGAFSGCKSLVKIDLPSSLRIIGKNAFKNCQMIESLSVSDRLDVLGDNAFSGCRYLTDFTSLPDFVTVSNAKRFGLNPRLVENYYAGKIMDVNYASIPSAKTELPNEETGAIKKDNTIIGGVAYGESDVDQLPAPKPQNNSNTFVFIIANEKYSSLPDVPFAINDGTSFRNYCTGVLGIPDRNITFERNATLGTLFQTIDYMKQIDSAFKGDLSFIVYYAGHGAPDEKNNKAYIIPTDAHVISGKTCLPLEDLYKELGSLQASSVKVFMDACFSGTGRTDDLLAQGGRSVKMVPKMATLSGNVVVLSATSNDQTAWHYKDQGHGLFTYCLLKKLQETNGETSMGELCDYLENEVPKLSIVVNRTAQTPTSQSSTALGNKWRLWQIKK